MFRRILRRWRSTPSSDRAPASESPDSAPTTAAPSVAPTFPVVSDGPEESSVRPAPADLYRDRVDALEAELATVRTDTTDAQDLLTLLRGAPGPELRQIPTAATQILSATRRLDAPRAKLVGLIE